MVATKTSIELEDLSELKIFCIRHNMKLKQFVNQAIRNEMVRMGAEPENRCITSGSDTVEAPSDSDPKNSEKKVAPKTGFVDVPKGFWKCSHCDALNESANKTGCCSECGEKIEETV